MCGIAGIVSSTDESAIRRALAVMAHRGPDASGVHRDPSGVVLGHRRLAVIDLSPTGAQPMSSDDGRITVVFNGEIYDHAALRHALGEARFRGTSDTEVLLRGYEAFGIDGLLERIRGMFAFGIWDARDRTLHLARDAFGKKPLFVARRGRGLAFASTLPAMLELLEERPTLRLDALLDLLTLTYVPGPGSMFEGITKLDPGTRLSFREGREPEVRRFFEPTLGPFESHDEDTWVDRIDAALDAAVKRRLEADVPLGAFLSGGLDSSLVVASMARQGTRVRTIAMGFEDEALDERPFARAVAAHFGTEHTEIVLRPDALASLPALVHHSGEPLADHALLPTWLLAREAKKNVTVVLTGDGGDELFGGYESYRAVALARALSSLPLETIRDVAGYARGLGRRGEKLASRVRLVAAYANGGGEYLFDPTGVRAFRGHLDGLLAPSLEARRRTHDPDAMHREAALAARGLSWVDRAMSVDLRTQLPDDFLVKTDVATMGHGLEARCPFLDVGLFDLARRMPWTTKLRFGRTKRPLRRLAAKHLPRALVARPKHGFSPPTGRWLMRDGGEAIVRKLLLGDGGLDERFVRRDAVARLVDIHARGEQDHGQRLWTLLVADAWIRAFVDRTLGPEDDLRAFAAELDATVGC